MTSRQTHSELARAWQRLEPRHVHGIAAVLLPYQSDGRVDWEGF